MAAGRHGGYRDNGFRDRESDIEVMRRRSFHYSKEEYYCYQNGHGREIERNKERNDKDASRLRQKDTKQREVINGGYHSSFNKSNSGSTDSEHRRVGMADRQVDREPGELSSGSGSDGAIASESQVKDKEVSKFVNGVQSYSAKKRKFSPIVWDREEKEAVKISRNRIAPSDFPLPPPPMIPKSLRQSLKIIPEGVIQLSPIKPKHLHTPQLSPMKPMVVPCSVGSAVTDLSAGLSSSLAEEMRLSSDPEPEHLKEEEFVPTRSISASRWADKDEGAVTDDEDLHRTRKKMIASRPLDTSLGTKLLSPEIGELIRMDLGGTRAKSSESDEGGHRVRSACEGEFPENELDKNDYMEIDMNGENNNRTAHQSDTYSEGKNDSHRPQRSLNMLQGCRSVYEFERLNRIDEGTYGVVFRARDKRTGEVVALKKVKMEKEREGFPLTSLREINILLSSHHPSIVDVKEVVTGKNFNDVYMVMEYMEHDLKGLMETMKQPFSQSEVKCLMLQLLEGVKFLHDNWVLHRDLKTSNLLLNNQGELKICDFGLSRQYGSPLKPYTQLVVTLWYRAPELLLGVKQYSTAIDMWSLGCIMAELLSKDPLFSGKSELDQLDKIFRTLGTPNEIIWPGFSKLPGVKANFVKHKYNLLRKKFPPTSFTGSPILSESGFDLLNRLLTYDPEKRITAEDAVNHEWFREVPLPKSKDFMPTFPAQHAQDRRRRTIMKSPDPLEEQRIKELQQGEIGTGGLFS